MKISPTGALFTSIGSMVMVTALVLTRGCTTGITENHCLRVMHAHVNTHTHTNTHTEITPPTANDDAKGSSVLERLRKNHSAIV